MPILDNPVPIGTGLALDWPIGTGLADWHRIDQVLEIGELILDQKVDLGMTSDWHRIGFKWQKNGSD